MILFTYDRYSVPVADGYCDTVYKAIRYLENTEPDKDHYHTHSTQNILDRLRVGVLKGEIDHTRVRIFFQPYNADDRRMPEVELRIDKDGRIDEWPEGFADYNEKQLMALLDW